MGMWIAIVCGLMVLGAAAYVALGHFGEMQTEPVLDRPRGRVPDGPVTAGFLAEARLPTASAGYDRTEVDAYLDEIAAGTAGPATDAVFVVRRGGYDMQVIDELLRRPRVEFDPAQAVAPEPTTA
ncbi:DivIVA domain-containing protein [Tessaracoccus lacteus]|uniref:DivIVA domain-containing protein n=1 Tax=Tessaracoccus lacteus TaxID=3041766 RepID=A0ABY8PW35_9ACTN|nr:DivIVA domain-containing protein [Tessaracoccus sp. T21]WGT46587.1 DivIVA domain-containing protein [Tessaracoccus sp. T21]